MTIALKTLIAPKFAEATDTTQYTSTNVHTIVDKFTCRNNDTSARTLTVNLVQLGNPVASSNVQISRSILPGETYTFPEIVGHILEPGAFISTLASNAGVLSIRASGRVVS